MPFTFGAMTVAGLAAGGLPLLGGFVAKWMICGGLFEAACAPRRADFAELGSVVAVLGAGAAIFASLAALAGCVRMVHAVFMGPAARESEACGPVPVASWMPMLALSAACVVLGVIPHNLLIRSFLAPAVAAAGFPADAGLTGAGLVGLAPAGGAFWSPAAAGALALGGLLVAGAVLLAAGAARVRVVRPFTGGETWAGSAEETRLPGGALFDDLAEARPVAGLLRDAAEGAYDPFELVGSWGSGLSGALRSLHGGELPVYLGFCVLGLLAVLVALLGSCLGIG
jgi:hypothetical protein